MHEVVCAAFGASLVSGQCLLQVDFQPIQRCQAAVVLQRGQEGSQLAQLKSEQLDNASVTTMSSENSQCLCLKHQAPLTFLSFLCSRASLCGLYED